MPHHCPRHSALFPHFFASIAVALFACLPIAAHAQQPNSSASPARSIIAIEHVTVIPMTPGSDVLRDATVIIEDDRIISLSGPIPADANRIDATGKWLIPGLTDMHVHVPTDGYLRPKRYPTEPPSLFFSTQDIMTPYLANGVTQILNLDSRPEHFAQRNQVEKGEVLGPHMALAAVINSGNPNGFSAATPSDGRQAVRDAKSQGYEFIKPYSALAADVFIAIIDESSKQGLKTVGHIPDAFQGNLDATFVPHFGMVAHAEELAKHSTDFTDADAARFAQLLKNNGTWLSPTLTVMRWIASQSRSLDELAASPNLQYLHPLLQSKWLMANRYRKNGTPELAGYFDRMVDFHNRLVRACKAAGVPIVAGTDTLTSGVIAGFSLHEELALLVAAGLTPREALDAATRQPCVWLGVDSDRGTIEPGKRADFVLLDHDPLADIANTRAIAGVCVNGRWTDRNALDAMLADLAKRNLAMKDQFTWPGGKK
jgi:cytosine/adenosine deaminase-related metal-dependent hydrolase